MKFALKLKKKGILKAMLELYERFKGKRYFFNHAKRNNKKKLKELMEQFKNDIKLLEIEMESLNF